jgi:hypothetical protein
VLLYLNRSSSSLIFASFSHIVHKGWLVALKDAGFESSYVIPDGPAQVIGTILARKPISREVGRTWCIFILFLYHLYPSIPLM